MNYLICITSYSGAISEIDELYCRSYIATPDVEYSKSRIREDYLFSVLDLKLPEVTYSSNDSVMNI